MVFWGFMFEMHITVNGLAKKNLVWPHAWVCIQVLTTHLRGIFMTV